MTIIKFEWSPLVRCYNIPPFDINKTNDLSTDYLDIFIINFTFYCTLCIIIVLRQGTLCVYIGIFIQTGGDIFATLGLRSVSPPLTFTLDAICYHSTIPVHCHLLDFVCYTPYSGIIFLTVEYRIY